MNKYDEFKKGYEQHFSGEGSFKSGFMYAWDLLGDKLAAAEARVKELEAAASAYMYQLGVSCYVSKDAWRQESDILGQNLMDVLERKQTPDRAKCIAEAYGKLDKIVQSYADDDFLCARCEDFCEALAELKAARGKND